MAGIGRVALERVLLHLDAEQLELGDVALLGAEPLESLEIGEHREVLLGELERRQRRERLGERLLDPENDLAPHIGQLELAHARAGAGALDPPAALATRLDRLPDGHRVLDERRAAVLLARVGGRGVGDQPGGDLVGSRRLELVALRAERGVGAERQADRFVQCEAGEPLLGARGPDAERERDATYDRHENPDHRPPPRA